MQNAVPKGEGGMLAVLGSKVEIIEDLLSENKNNFIVQIANDNSEGQIVLSGRNSDIEKLIIKGPKALGDENSKNTIIGEATEALIGAVYKCFNSIQEVNLWLDDIWEEDLEIFLRAPIPPTFPTFFIILAISCCCFTNLLTSCTLEPEPEAILFLLEAFNKPTLVLSFFVIE